MSVGSPERFDAGSCLLRIFQYFARVFSEPLRPPGSICQAQKSTSHAAQESYRSALLPLFGDAVHPSSQASCSPHSEKTGPSLLRFESVPAEILGSLRKFLAEVSNFLEKLRLLSS